jgi:hypothetical protein
MERDIPMFTPIVVLGTPFDVFLPDMASPRIHGAVVIHHAHLCTQSGSLRCFCRGGLRHVLRNQFAKLANQLRALRNRLAGPREEGLYGGLHRSGNFVGAAPGDFREHILIRRVHGFEIIVCGGRFAVD